MDVYVRRTHGTYIERKGNELIWQFRDADPEFGFMQSKELEIILRDMMGVYNVEVIRGGGVADGYIEARPAGVSKGLYGRCIDVCLNTFLSLLYVFFDTFLSLLLVFFLLKSDDTIKRLMVFTLGRFRTNANANIFC